jgi:hypothetical protein
MEENVFVWKRQTKTPKMTQKSLKGSHVEDWGAFICCVGRRGWNPGVSQARSVLAFGTVSAVHANAAFSFTDCPLQWIEHEAVNEINEEPRKMDMEGLFLFLGKFGLDFSIVFVHRRVIIVAVTYWDLCRRALKMTRKRYALGERAFSSSVIRWWEIEWWLAAATGLHGIKSGVPVTVSIRVASPHPSKKVSVDEVKSQEGAGVEERATKREGLRRARRGAPIVKRGNGMTESSNPKLMVQKPLRTRAASRYSIRGRKILPGEMNKLVQKGFICLSSA